MNTSAVKIAAKEDTGQPTPMMAQYLGVKAQHKDCLVFYRMGDFYEMFFDDAVIASKILDLTLTKRGKTEGTDIPMCGVPFHSAEPYIAKLIRAGHKVAICEQCETPEEAKKRGGYKALVRRDVIRVITAGTIIEDNLLDAKANNYIVAVSEINKQIGLAIADVSTGEVLLQSTAASQLKNILSRLSPSEVICANNYNGLSDIGDNDDYITFIEQENFDSDLGLNKLQQVYDIDISDKIPNLTKAEISASGALISYIENTQRGKFPYLNTPRRLNEHDTMEIDGSTIRSLELIKTQNGTREGSLIDAIDLTVTACGARTFQSRLLAPLCNVDTINARLAEVTSFIKLYDITRTIRGELKSSPDMERAIARLSLGRGGPRDLAAIRDGITQAIAIRCLLIESAGNCDAIAHEIEALKPSPALNEFRDRIELALTPTPAFLARDGNFILTGFCPALDRLRDLQKESTRHIAALQTKYAQHTGIDSLKIVYNNVLGYFIEVPAKRADAMMVKGGANDNPYIHRQTMASAVRFTTPELAQLEQEILSSNDKALAIENEYFNEFVKTAISIADDISLIARTIGAIDVACAVATLAVDRNYVCPTITDDQQFEIKLGRHPVVEHSLKSAHKEFVPNNCALNDAQKLWLLTGPNMAGKSTFLRQNALITIMAQAGFYVPAASATIGCVDKVFSRVGASDDLAKGHSTFMMEMVETAAILKNATGKSMVILDEVGRGTSTFDGLSLAWAIVEFLHNKIACRGLFATHYHELTKLSENLKSLACYTMDVKEWQGDVVFLHSVKSGTADKSYGIHVAKLAGVPHDVLTRAEQVLKTLENNKTNTGAVVVDLPLFAPVVAAKHSKVDEMLQQINPDDLSPREALDVLYKLHKQLNCA